MASPITWRNINAPDFTGSATMLESGSQALQGGLDKLMQLGKDYQARQEQAWERGEERLTNDGLLQIAGAETIDQVNALRQQFAQQQSAGATGPQADALKILQAAQGRTRDIRTDTQEQAKFEDFQTQQQWKPFSTQIKSLIAANKHDEALSLLNSTDAPGSVTSSLYQALEADRQNDQTFNLGIKAKQLGLVQTQQQIGQSATEHGWKVKDREKQEANTLRTAAENRLISTLALEDRPLNESRIGLVNELRSNPAYKDSSPLDLLTKFDAAYTQVRIPDSEAQKRVTDTMDSWRKGEDLANAGIIDRPVYEKVLPNLKDQDLTYENVTNGLTANIQKLQQEIDNYPDEIKGMAESGTLGEIVGGLGAGNSLNKTLADGNTNGVTELAIRALSENAAGARLNVDGYAALTQFLEQDGKSIYDYPTNLIKEIIVNIAKQADFTGGELKVDKNKLETVAPKILDTYAKGISNYQGKVNKVNEYSEMLNGLMEIDAAKLEDLTQEEQLWLVRELAKRQQR